MTIEQTPRKTIDISDKYYLLTVEFVYSIHFYFQSYFRNMQHLLTQIDPSRDSFFVTYQHQKSIRNEPGNSLHRVLLKAWMSDFLVATKFVLELPRTEHTRTILMVDWRNPEHVERFKKVIVNDPE